MTIDSNTATTGCDYLEDMNRKQSNSSNMTSKERLSELAVVLAGRHLGLIFRRINLHEQEI
jgi:hypothetical protein